jgi:long-chain fatty acid transport protein
MFRAVIIVLVVLLSSRVFATGFFINQQSVKGQGRAGAGNAVAADELGTIFFNPAGLPKVVFDSGGAADWRVSVGTHVLVPRSDLRNRGSSSATPGSLGFSIPLSGGDGRDPADPTPIPNVFVAGALGNLAVGGGVTFPFGLATEYERDWHGRYDAIKASLTTTNIGLVAAYRVTPAVSIGGGVDLQRATTELETAIPNPLIPGGPTAATDASIDTEGDAFTVGFNVGAMWDVTDRVRIGAHYRSGMQHELEGTSTVRDLPGPLSLLNGSIGARATIDLPSITSVGARWQAGDVSLYGQGEWYDWSRFEEVRIRFDDGRPDAVRPANYRDAYALAVGAEWPVKSRWTLRAGVRYDTTPTVGGFRDATVPDSERTWLGAGASVDLSQRFALDLSLTYAFFADTNIGVTRTFFDNTPLASRVNVNSSVETDVTTVAAGFRVRF